MPAGPAGSKCPRQGAILSAMSATLQEVVAHLDEWLQIDSVADASWNGLQVEAGCNVARVALAVDACQVTIERAMAAEADLLLVHHGLFWGPGQRLAGALGARVGAAFRGNLSVYAAHLPLDLHPEVGNNVLLARALGASPVGTFAAIEGRDVGVLARLDEPTPLAEVTGALAASGCDDQTLWAFGPDPISTLAVLTGSGCSALGEAIAAGADCFITGESRHSAYHEALEAGLNCVFAGHYATETFGVRAVGENLRERFGVETHWIEYPTGV